MSVPISETTTCATTSLKPGMLSDARIWLEGFEQRPHLLIIAAMAFRWLRSVPGAASAKSGVAHGCRPRKASCNTESVA